MKQLTMFRLAIAIALASGVGVHAACTPPVTSGLVLAFDGSAVITNASGYVTAWTDQATGDGVQNITQATAAKQPLLDTVNLLNGNRVLLFDGTNTTAEGDELVGSYTLTPNGGITLFAVVRRDTQTAGGSSLRPFLALPGGNQTLLGFFNEGTPTMTRMDYNNVNAGIGYSRISDGQYHVISAIGSTNANGIQLFPDSYLQGWNTTAAHPTMTSVVIGGSNDGGNPSRHFRGPIAEVLVYNTVLSFTERRAVEVYLGTKYGLEIPAPPAATDLPVTAGLRAHFDSKYVATNGSGKVFCWESRTLDGTRAEQYTIANRPAHVERARYSHAVVRFNPSPSGANTPERLISNYTPETGSNLTVFTMIRQSGSNYVAGGSAIKAIVSAGDPTGTTPLYTLLNWRDDRNSLRVRSHNNTDAGLATAFSDGNFHITSGVVSNGVGMQGWYDGTNKFSVSKSGTPGLTVWAIGGHIYNTSGYDGSGFSGDMTAVIIYNRALTDAERQSVEAHLRACYGPPPGTVFSIR